MMSSYCSLPVICSSHSFLGKQLDWPASIETAGRTTLILRAWRAMSVFEVQVQALGQPDCGTGRR